MYPLIAIAKALSEKAKILGANLELIILGDGIFVERAAKENDIPFKKIYSGKFRRYFSHESIFDVLKIPLSFIQSFFYLFWFMPDIVFTKGGYTSFAPAIAAKLFFIPVFIHESDSVPGLANKIIGKMATAVFLSFKTTEKYFNSAKVVFTGNPVRKNLAQGDKNSAREYFNLYEPKPTILILGGSQGAKIINEVIVSSLVVLAEKFNIIHQCGESQLESVKKDVDTILQEGTQQYSALLKTYYRYYSFLDENQYILAFSIADIVISRAGSGALFEIAQAGKPAIIIPISQSPGDHQYLNALEFGLFGGQLLEESNLNRESLIHRIENILKPENYDLITEKIKTFAKPDAADKIAESLLSMGS